ncbi:MAG: alpha/beta hydrolase family protein [Acidimicrobiales bacterium]
MSPSAPFGTWPSALSGEVLALQRGVTRSSLASGFGALWWLEARPQDGGRVVLVRAPRDADPQVVSPSGVSIRSRVHEYGGGAWCLLKEAGSQEPSFAFVEDDSQRIFWATPNGDVRPVTSEPPAGEHWRHGGLVAGPRGLVCVREATAQGVNERSIVAVDTSSSTVSTLCRGRDFYGSLAVSHDGRSLAYVCWDSPNMPWDKTELRVATLAEGGRALLDEVVMGGNLFQGCSVDQPCWIDPSTLVFIADRLGWWHPWMQREGEDPAVLCDMEADFQGPAWALGQHTLVASGSSIACRWTQNGIDHLGVLDPGGDLVEIHQPCVSISQLCAHEGGLAWLGRSHSSGSSLFVCLEPPGGATTTVVEAPQVLARRDVSRPETLAVGAPDGRQVHATFYAPRLGGWEGPAGAAPPLIVLCHGGPTASAQSGFDPVVQALTSRGFAVAAVDYSGSTGYGRAYRDALYGHWGELDSADCVAVARWLGRSGRVDPATMAIRGVSAGGLTALNALVGDSVFKAAVCWYPVCDLVAALNTSVSFEAQYTERLVGRFPQVRATYEARSPVNRVDEMHGAVLLLHGEDDPVVDPATTRQMAAALTRRGARVEALFFAQERHGFRRLDTLSRAFRAELAFYQEVLVDGRSEPSRARPEV